MYMFIVAKNQENTYKEYKLYLTLLRGKYY